MDNFERVLCKVQYRVKCVTRRGKHDSRVFAQNINSIVYHGPFVSYDKAQEFIDNCKIPLDKILSITIKKDLIEVTEPFELDSFNYGG